MGIDFAGLGIAPLTYPISLAPWIVLGWVVLGGVYLTYLQRSRPQAIDAIGRVFQGGEVPEDVVVQPRAASPAEASLATAR